MWKRCILSWDLGVEESGIDRVVRVVTKQVSLDEWNEKSMK